MTSNILELFAKRHSFYDINDNINFTNMLGYTFQYRINKIKRIDSLSELLEYEEELLVVIKDYYAMEYIVFMCNPY